MVKFIREKDLVKKVEKRLDKILSDNTVEKLFEVIMSDKKRIN